MAKVTVEDVLAMKSERERTFSDRNSNFKLDERMYWLESSDSDVQDIEKVILPTPHNIINLGRDLLSGQPMTIQVPPPSERDKAKERAQKTEDFLLLAWDRIQRDTGITLVSDILHFALLRGQYLVRVMADPDRLTESEDGTVGVDRFPIVIQVVDPYYVYPEFVAGELDNYIMVGEFSTSYIKKRWPKESKKIDFLGEDKKTELSNVEWIEYWDKDNKVYLANSQKVVNIKHGYGFLPAVFGWGRRTPSNDPQKMGVGMLFPFRGIYRQENRLASMICTAVSDYENSAWGVVTEQKGFELDLSHGAINYFRLGESVNPIIRGTLPVDVGRMFSILEQNIYQSGFPPAVQGQTPEGVTAGYAISLLTHGGRLKIYPIKNQVEWALSRVNEMILRLVEWLGNKPYNLEIPMAGIPEPGRMVDMKYGKDDVKGYYTNQVTLVADIPTDEIAKAQMYRLTTEGGDPGLSKESGRHRFLGVQSPSREQEKIDREQMHRVTRDGVSAELQQALVQSMAPQQPQPLLAPEQQQQPEQLPYQVSPAVTPGMPGQMPAGNIPSGTVEGQQREMARRMPGGRR